MPELPGKLSRRLVLRMVGVAAPAAIAASCAPAQPAAPPPPVAQPVPPPPPPPMAVKQTKIQAAYQNFPRGRQRCGVCVHFRPPNDCEVIEGPVSPNGWCRNFVPRYPGGEHG